MNLKITSVCYTQQQSHDLSDDLHPPENAGGAAGEPQGGSSEAARPPPRRDRGQAEDAGRARRVRIDFVIL